MAIRTRLDGDDNDDFEKVAGCTLRKGPGRAEIGGGRQHSRNQPTLNWNTLLSFQQWSVIIENQYTLCSSTYLSIANIKFWWYYTWEKCDWVWISPKMLDVLLHPSKSHHLFSGPCQSVDQKPQDFRNQVSILSDIRRAWLSFISIPLPHTKKIKINNTSIFEHKTKRSSTWSRRPALPSTPSSPR